MRQTLGFFWVEPSVIEVLREYFSKPCKTATHGAIDVGPQVDDNVPMPLSSIIAMLGAHILGKTSGERQGLARDVTDRALDLAYEIGQANLKTRQAVLEAVRATLIYLDKNDPAGSYEEVGHAWMDAHDCAMRAGIDQDRLEILLLMKVRYWGSRPEVRARLESDVPTLEKVRRALRKLRIPKAPLREAPLREGGTKSGVSKTKKSNAPKDRESEKKD